MPRKPTEPSRFRITGDAILTAEERSAVGAGDAVASCAKYFPFSTRDTELFWAKAYDGERLVAIAPVTRLRKRKATDMLRQPLRRWLGLLFGPLAWKTTLLVDTAFMAYDARSPFFTAPGVDRDALKREMSQFLKSHKKVDTVWISETAEEAAWAATEGYEQFQTLPMVHVSVAGCRTLDDYLATIKSRNRRRNFRRERDIFAKAGGTIQIDRGVLGDNPPLLDAVLACLGSSAAHSKFTVPYNDVLTAREAFAVQDQIVLTARLDSQVIGFMSCLVDGNRLMQCHGGLDYVRSHEVKAYHNLISRAIELAIELGLDRLTLGPMTNETKRRAGGELVPIVSSLWNKLPGDRLVAKHLFIKNFEVYRGPVGAALEEGDEE